MLRRRKEAAFLGLVGLAVVGVLVIRPWSGDDVRVAPENEIPVASEYSSPSELADDLNEQGLGCAHTMHARLLRLSYRYLAIHMDRRLLPDALICSVGGQRVLLNVFRPAALKAVMTSQPTPGRYTDLQDAADAAVDEGTGLLNDDGIDAMLVGPNWTVIAAGDSVMPLSTIRAEIGGTLVLAPTPTPTPSRAT